jgi:hypothetical protein
VKVAQIGLQYANIWQLHGNGIRNHNVAWLGVSLKPSRYVNAFAVDVLFLDKRAADMEAHTEPNLPLRWLFLRRGDEATLHGDGTPDSVLYRTERSKEAIAGVFD